ncbi:MAG TPA: hypothetical protein VLI72_06705 [Methylibium sp.]|nr:hypothetical protein [Methylibium sp.]
MDEPRRDALIEGLSDAAGFVLGALAGAALGRLTGFDFFAQPGYEPRAMVGLVLIALGCGVGKALARRWHAQRRPPR